MSNIELEDKLVSKMNYYTRLSYFKQNKEARDRYYAKKEDERILRDINDRQLENEKEERHAGIIIAIIFTVVIITGIITSIGRQKAIESLWNNGIHKEDNGHWELIDTVSSYMHTGYIYKCDKCGYTIELNQLMNR